MKPHRGTRRRQRRVLLRRRVDRRAFQELFTQTVNPFANPSERRWIPVTVDLSPRRGGDGVILNTRATGAPEAPPTIATTSALGAPEIVRR